MNKFIWLIFFLLFLITNPSDAQISYYNGYIIKNSGDTIYGRIEYNRDFIYKRCNFINKNSKDIEVISPEQVNLVYVSPNIIFRSLEFKEEKQFFKILSEGKLNLYCREKDMFISNNLYPLTKLSGGKKQIILEGRSFIKDNVIYRNQLKAYVNDSLYYETIDKLEFNEDIIYKFIHKYNKYRFTDIKMLLDNSLHRKNNIGILTGMVFNYIGISDNEIFDDSLHIFNTVQSDINSFSGWLFGISYKHSLDISDSYIDLKVLYEMYPKQKFSVYYKQDFFSIYRIDSKENIDSSDLIQDDYSVNSNSVNIPLNINLVLSNGKLRPGVNFGLNYKIYLEKKVIVTRKRYDQVNSMQTITLNWPKYMLGLDAGFNCTYMINWNSNINAGVNFELFNPLSDTFYDKIFSIQSYISYCF